MKEPKKNFVLCLYADHNLCTAIRFWQTQALLSFGVVQFQHNKKSYEWQFSQRN